MKNPIGKLALLTATGVFALGGLMAGPAHATTTDADNDGMTDTWEVFFKLDPHNAADALTDPDHDGLINKYEFSKHGNPRVQDTDKDGQDDRDEVVGFTKVNVADTNGNGIKDGQEDADHDGIKNEDEDDALESCIGDDRDSDHDGVADEDEDELRLVVGVADTDKDGIVDGNEDTDHDGRLNEDEDDHEGDRCVRDSDHDGIENEDEGDLAGSITSFDAGTNALTVSLTAGGSVTITVDADSKIKFESEGSNSGSGGGGSTGTTADLKAGAQIAELEFHSGILDEIELIPAA